jgi:hypothetical protein
MRNLGATNKGSQGLSAGFGVARLLVDDADGLLGVALSISERGETLDLLGGVAEHALPHHQMVCLSMQASAGLASDRTGSECRCHDQQRSGALEKVRHEQPPLGGDLKISRSAVGITGTKADFTRY